MKAKRCITIFYSCMLRFIHILDSYVFLLSCSHGKGLHLMLITTHMKNNVYIPDVDSACWVKNTMHTFQYDALTGSGNLNCLRDTRRVSEHRENFDHMCKAPARPDLYQLISAPSFNWKLLKVKN